MDNGGQRQRVCGRQLPGAGPTSGHSGLAGWAQPLSDRNAVQGWSQTEQVEGLVAFITENEFLIVTYKTSICHKTEPFSNQVPGFA